MAELILNIPIAGEKVLINMDKEISEMRMTFEFEEIIFEKTGPNLELFFESNNATIVLENFYSIYNDQFIPDFLIGSNSISGKDFFSALDQNLMPAADSIFNQLSNSSSSFAVFDNLIELFNSFINML